MVAQDVLSRPAMATLNGVPSIRFQRVNSDKMLITNLPLNPNYTIVFIHRVNNTAIGQNRELLSGDGLQGANRPRLRKNNLATPMIQFRASSGSSFNMGTLDETAHTYFIARVEDLNRYNNYNTTIGSANLGYLNTTGDLWVNCNATLGNIGDLFFTRLLYSVEQ
jgi:hypothetical protein